MKEKYNPTHRYRSLFLSARASAASVWGLDDVLPRHRPVHVLRLHRHLIVALVVDLRLDDVQPDERLRLDTLLDLFLSLLRSQMRGILR